MEVAEKLLNHGVITIPGAAFGNQSEGFLRVSFCADNDKLAEECGARSRRWNSLANSCAISESDFGLWSLVLGPCYCFW